MNADQIATLNACNRFLHVGVLRMAGGDCTNKGLTSRYSGLFIPHPQGPFTGEELEASGSAHLILELLPPVGMSQASIARCPVRVKPAAIESHSMAGGNFVYSSDSRFSALYGAPLSVHDRVEG